MSTTTGWTTHNSVDGGVVAGEIVSSNGFFRPNSFGEGTSWHGPALKTSLSQALKDFRVEAEIEFLNTGGNKRGRVEIYLLDTQSRAIAKLALKDSWSIARAWGEARAGDN
ncbi:distal tail protein Dit, partial [Sutcliffiella cohnii]